MILAPSPIYHADPHGSALTAAVQWLQGTLLGPMATTVAVIAVACVGLMMLSGGVTLRRAREVSLGCFILLGASSIATALRLAFGGFDNAAPNVMPPPAPTPVALLSPTILVDPYAGAAVPDRH